MLRVKALQLLLTGGANRDELRCAIELPLVRLELGSCGQVRRLRVSQLRAEDVHQRLPAAYLIAELGEHPCDAPGDERRDHHLPVGVGFDRSGHAHPR